MHELCCIHNFLALPRNDIIHFEDTTHRLFSPPTFTRPLSKLHRFIREEQLFRMRYAFSKEYVRVLLKTVRKHSEFTWRAFSTVIVLGPQPNSESN